MTFERLRFDTRIHYELRPPCFSLNRLREIVDDYCDLCDENETAIVPAGFTNCVEMHRDTASRDCLGWVKCALKVTSYFTLIIPALMYFAKSLLRSSPFYVIPQAQAEPIAANSDNIQLKRLIDGDVQIGQFVEWDSMCPGVHIHNGVVVEFMPGSAEDQRTLMCCLIEKHHVELTSAAPPIVQQFFQRVVPDSFICNALRISYGYGSENYSWMQQKYEIAIPSESEPLKKRNVTLRIRQSVDTHQSTFEHSILLSLVSHLSQKEHPSLIDKWIFKALKNEKFSEEEFHALSVDVQQLACMIAKIYHRETFWWQAENCLKPPTRRLLQYTIPDDFSQNVMAYTGQPHVTARVCRTWAHFTRTAPARLLLDFFNKEDDRNYIRLVIHEQIKNCSNDTTFPYQLMKVMHSFIEKTDENNDHYIGIIAYINTLNYSGSRNLLEVIRTHTSKNQTLSIDGTYESFIL